MADIKLDDLQKEIDKEAKDAPAEVEEEKKSPFDGWTKGPLIFAGIVVLSLAIFTVYVLFVM